MKFEKKIQKWFSINHNFFSRNYRLEHWHTIHSLTALRNLGILTLLCSTGGICFHLYNKLHSVHFTYVQGYPQRMRLQRRLYVIVIVCNLTFMIPCNCKLVFIFAKWFNKPFNSSIYWFKAGRRFEPYPLNRHILRALSRLYILILCG